MDANTAAAAAAVVALRPGAKETAPQVREITTNTSHQDGWSCRHGLRI